MQDVYKNADKYTIDKEHKILIVFDDMVADMINSKKLNSIVTKLLILRFQKMLEQILLAFL